MTEPTAEAPSRIECRADEGFASWLAGANGSVVITTYQAGKVVLVGWDGQRVTVLARDFPKPMGLAVDGPRLLLATRNEVVLLADAPVLVRFQELCRAVCIVRIPRSESVSRCSDARVLDGPA